MYMSTKYVHVYKIESFHNFQKCIQQQCKNEKVKLHVLEA